MKYLDKSPFTVPVSNGKLTDRDLERMVGPKPGAETATKTPKKRAPRLPVFKQK